MNKKFVLTLLTSPVLFASMLSVAVMAQPASANPINSTEPNAACAPGSQNARRLVCQRASQTNQTSPKVVEFSLPQNQPSPVTELEFTEDESNAAVAMFGCDCPVCINAIRQMRGLPPIPV